MFGHLKAQPILRVDTCSINKAVDALLTTTENAEPVRWIEFPTAILLLVAVPRSDPLLSRIAMPGGATSISRP